MRKFLRASVLIVLISCAAVWGTQRIGLFPRLSGAFSLMASGEASSNHGRPAQETQGVQGQRPNRHVMPSPLETWKNVLAYVAVFAFVVMATYYGEQGVCAWAGRRKPR